MRRLAYLSLGMLLLIVTAIAILPGRAEKVDGGAVLKDALDTMRGAKSLHIVNWSGSYGSQGSETFVNLQSAPMEFWRTPHSYYTIHLKEDGTRFGKYASIGCDSEKHEAWVYEPEKKTLHIAKLDDAASLLVDMIAARQDGSIYAISLDTWNALPDAAKSARKLHRDGREIFELSTIENEPYGFVVRNVLDVDASTHHILGRHTYVHDSSTPEKLSGVVDKVGYDVPLPSDLVGPQVPADTVRIPARVEIDNNEYSTDLWLITQDGRRLYLQGFHKGKPSGRAAGGMMGMSSGPAGPPLRGMGKRSQDSSQ